jgi:hypothetical protein
VVRHAASLNFEGGFGYNMRKGQRQAHARMVVVLARNLEVILYQENREIF